MIKKAKYFKKEEMEVDSKRKIYSADGLAELFERDLHLF